MSSIYPTFLLFLLLPISQSQPTNSSSEPCPLDFSVLTSFFAPARTDPSWLPTTTHARCIYALQGLHLVLSQYLQSQSLFLPPPNSSAACWSSYDSFLTPSFIPPPFSLLSDCGFQPQSISQGCMNITTRSDFESAVTPSSVQDMDRNCAQDLGSSPYAATCTACTTSLSRVKAARLPGPDHGNVTTCSDYPSIYAAAAIAQGGPASDGSASCLFLLKIPSDATGGGGAGRRWIYGVVFGCVVVLALTLLFGSLWLRRRRKKIEMEKRRKVTEKKSQSLESIASLIKFSFEEIRAATKNFSRENIIGTGGYGNVYRGRLADGTEVALKRFKNCSAAGDASFEHEVQVIASVRHVNLVALRGYCTATTTMEGHQRIIVCDLMKNGSLHDHLFGAGRSRLSWPIRQRIAVGTARGLAYLHYGAQPAILHRDIKASNILLDDEFEPKVADFGLARFSPEGMTHVSTRVAGTLGYVAPEYALYGQLTEKSDVYSFGIVLLELLSGKKAFLSTGGGQNALLTDWAWSLVRKGRPLDVIEEGMEELGPREVMEKYVLAAVLSSHPELHARPTMDQIVKILDTDLAVPTIPERPLPIVANLDEIERSVSSSGSGQLSSISGYQQFVLAADSQILINRSGSASHSNE